MTKPVRVRKVRKAGKLSCGHFAIMGQQKVSVNGRPWICVQCRLEQLRAIAPKRLGLVHGE
jgi:hypothetical protein